MRRSCSRRSRRRWWRSARERSNRCLCLPHCPQGCLQPRQLGRSGASPVSTWRRDGGRLGRRLRRRSRQQASLPQRQRQQARRALLARRSSQLDRRTGSHQQCCLKRGGSLRRQSRLPRRPPRRSSPSSSQLHLWCRLPAEQPAHAAAAAAAAAIARATAAAMKTCRHWPAQLWQRHQRRSRGTRRPSLLSSGGCSSSAAAAAVLPKLWQAAPLRWMQPASQWQLKRWRLYSRSCSLLGGARRQAWRKRSRSFRPSGSAWMSAPSTASPTRAGTTG